MHVIPSGKVPVVWSLCFNGSCDLCPYCVYVTTTKTNNELTTPVWQLDNRCLVIQT